MTTTLLSNDLEQTSSENSDKPKYTLLSSDQLSTASQLNKKESSQPDKKEASANTTVRVNKTLDTNKKNIKASIRTNNLGIDELSVGNIQTESEIIPANKPLITPEVSVSETKPPQTGGTDINTSEYIDNLTSSEAHHLESEYEKMVRSKSSKTSKTSKTSKPTKSTPQKGGVDVDQPTLVNYWADWCGYSKKFQEPWNDFKKTAGQKYPGLKVTELNVKRDPELNKLASQVGVTGYPTLVLFHQKKPHLATAGNMSINNIHDFINSIVNN